MNEHFLDIFAFGEAVYVKEKANEIILQKDSKSIVRIYLNLSMTVTA